MEQMDLPRFYMSGLLGYEEQIFHLMMMKKYEVLEQVNSVDEFKKIFIDVVNAHHWVWKTSAILHHNISANNIMFYRKDGLVMGVLCNWDLAVKEPSKEEFKEDTRERVLQERSLMMASFSGMLWLLTMTRQVKHQNNRTQSQPPMHEIRMKETNRLIHYLLRQRRKSHISDLGIALAQVHSWHLTCYPWEGYRFIGVVMI
ncbi:hypothetical protein AcW2_005874 [Taiwanofungus camphoratus]|nr:hypothetical protein AcW2_005874 [Antrodia cinnamomea]